MFRQMPVILAILIITIICLGSFIPQIIAIKLFALSLTIKSAIIFILPFIIFSLLFKASVSLAKDASKIIIIIFSGVIISNFFVTTITQFIGSWIYNFDISISMPDESNTLTAESFFDFPVIIQNHVAMFSGIILGIINAKVAPSGAMQLAKILESIVNKLLKIITALIPIFVTGFVIKLQFDGIIVQIIKDYTTIFAIIGFAQLGYITLLYFAFNKFHFRKSINAIRNMLPAGMSGFSTMSSAASMPLTIIGTEKNARNKDLVHTVVPATVNIHLIGDCIAIPCFAFAIMKNFDVAQPDLLTYFIFTLYFVIAKFSVAAIPGGGIIVMLPILEQYLGFNSNMLSLITALYILFDPIITGANVLGNGAFAKMIDIIAPKKQQVT
jgi:Na+/H+-dicarboxylate symporter